MKHTLQLVKVLSFYFNGFVFQYYSTPHDLTYQFFLLFPLEHTYESFKSNLQHVKLLVETLKNLMHEVNHWHDLLLKFHCYKLTIKKY